MFNRKETDYSTNRGLNRYEMFFLAGSYVMVPELFFSKEARRLTRAYVKLGLALDDAWDFGLDRKRLTGQFICPDRFYDELSKDTFTRLKNAQQEVETILDSQEENRWKRRLKINFNRFEQGIMLVEGLALAVPYNKHSWPDNMVDLYRLTDALVWGAMHVALKPGTQLELPDFTGSIDIYSQNPAIGLSDLYYDYSKHLLQEGPDGREGIALAHEMMFVQIEMDRSDNGVNKSYGSPAFAIFSDDDSWLDERRGWHVGFSREMDGMSITSRIAPLFSTIYKIVSRRSSWRDVEGWKETFLTSTVSI